LRVLRQLKTTKMCRKNSMRRRETPGLWMNTTANDQLRSITPAAPVRVTGGKGNRAITSTAVGLRQAE
jgi:hypothetical protein